MWLLELPAAPHPCLLRRERRWDDKTQEVGERCVGVADVVRYVASARMALRGPLAVQIEGPGDPLASPETVLRSMALLHEHHPDVLTGVVIDGPLLAEYVEDFVDFGLSYIVLRIDAAAEGTARRLVDGALFRGDVFDRDAAAELMVEAVPQALRLAARHDLPTLARFTLVPTINAGEVEDIAVLAKASGAARMEVVPHVPLPGSALARAGSPTREELADARRIVAAVFEESEEAHPTLAWLVPERVQRVDVDALETVDVVRVLAGDASGPNPAPLLPPRRAQLTAVATRDGTLVDTPLTGAHLLRIYAVTEDQIRLLGSRALPLDPKRRHDGVGDPQSFLQAVVGCRTVVATHIPPRARTLLEAVGIRPVAIGGPLDEVLDRVARGTVHRAESGI